MPLNTVTHSLLYLAYFGLDFNNKRKKHFEFLIIIIIDVNVNTKRKRKIGVNMMWKCQPYLWHIVIMYEAIYWNSINTMYSITRFIYCLFSIHKSIMHSVWRIPTKNVSFLRKYCLESGRSCLNAIHMTKKK